MTDQKKDNEATKTPDNETENTVYEVLVSFVPVERALLRIAASSEEMAKAAIESMAAKDVKHLTIESIKEVTADEPIPDEFEEEGTQVGPDLKVVH